jgi:hypothetical protein
MMYVKPRNKQINKERGKKRKYIHEYSKLEYTFYFRLYFYWLLAKDVLLVRIRSPSLLCLVLLAQHTTNIFLCY